MMKDSLERERKQLDQTTKLLTLERDTVKKNNQLLEDERSMHDADNKKWIDKYTKMSSECRDIEREKNNVTIFLFWYLYIFFL